MISTLKTKDFTKLTNLLNDGISYQGNTYIVDFKKIKDFVNSPEKYSILSPTSNVEENFYKNLALYIINNSISDKVISVNLNDSAIITNGIFEFLKSVYLNKPHLFIEHNEQENNQILIKKQIPKTTLESINIELLSRAKDSNQIESTSLFEEETKIVNENKINWKSSFIFDKYSDFSFIKSELQNISNKKLKTEEFKKEFSEFLRLVDKSIINDTKFHIEILKIKNTEVQNFLFGNPNFFNFDINSSFLKDFITQQLDEDSSFLLETIFSLKSKSSYFSNFDLTPFINHPFIIKSIPSRYTSKFSSSQDFNILSVYPMLNTENKNNKELIQSYLKAVKKEDTYDNPSSSSYPEYNLMTIPLSNYKDPELFKQVLNSIDFLNFKKLATKENIDFDFLNDSSILLKEANKLSNKQIHCLLFHFTPQEKITKNLMKDIISLKPGFFNYIQDSSRWERPMFYKPFYDDFEFILLAFNKGFPLSKINESVVLPHLLKEDKNIEETDFKLSYLFEKYSRITYFSPSNNYINSAAFNKKYKQNQYLFLYRKDPTRRNSELDNFFPLNTEKIPGTIGQIKDKNEILNLIQDSIKASNSLTSSTQILFDGNLFYSNLHNSLKIDVEIINELISHGLQFQTLTETSKYNKEILLSMIEKNPKVINLMPQQFVNDIDFVLKLSKLVDRHILKPTQLPASMLKFFTNHGISENHHEFLSTYIHFNQLKNLVPEKTETAEKTSRPKI